MFGMYKKLAHEFTGTFTGKGREFGGSLIRPEATGYGNIYFLLEMLKTKGTDLKGKTCLISGSGNVAQSHCRESTGDGWQSPDNVRFRRLHIRPRRYRPRKAGLHHGTQEPLPWTHPRICRAISGRKYVEGARPWGEKADIALPSATQNEINGDDAKKLIANGVIAVSEGANMPSTPEAIKVFQEAKILYAPGKAANAGGVSVSGLEMTQNSIKLGWSAEEVDEKLKSIMKEHPRGLRTVRNGSRRLRKLRKGRQRCRIMKVAKAMMAQGIL